MKTEENLGLSMGFEIFFLYVCFRDKFTEKMRKCKNKKLLRLKFYLFSYYYLV